VHDGFPTSDVEGKVVCHTVEIGLKRHLFADAHLAADELEVDEVDGRAAGEPGNFAVIL